MLRVEIQLTNAEGITDLEKHHLVTIILIAHSGKNRWILKLVGESLSSYRIFTQSQSISPQDTY